MKAVRENNTETSQNTTTEEREPTATSILYSGKFHSHITKKKKNR